MINEIDIVRELKIMKDDVFQRMCDRLFYEGAFSDICPPGTIVEIHGINTAKNTSKPSPGYTDSDEQNRGLSIEYSTSETWKEKLKKDIKKLKDRKIKNFIFVTNEDLGERLITYKRKEIPVRQYCKKELKCEKAYILGVEELKEPLGNPLFWHIRREYLNLEEDLFVNWKNFLKIISSIVSQNDYAGIDETTVNETTDAIISKLKFDRKKYYIISSPQVVYKRLLFFLSKVGEKLVDQSSKDEREEEMAFIRWPADQNNSFITQHQRELDNHKNNLVIIWNAQRITNLTNYLNLISDKTTFVFVCPEGQEEKIKKPISDFGTALECIYLNYPSDFPIKIKEATVAEIIDHKKKVDDISEKINGLILSYEALLYFYYPLYLNDTDTRKKIRQLLSINEKEEETLINITVMNGIAEKTGDILTLTKQEIGKSLLNELVDKGKFNIEELIAV